MPHLGTKLACIYTHIRHVSCPASPGTPGFSSPASTSRMSLSSSVQMPTFFPSIQLLGLEMLLHYFQGPDVVAMVAKNKLILSLGKRLSNSRSVRVLVSFNASALMYFTWCCLVCLCHFRRKLGCNQFVFLPPQNRWTTPSFPVPPLSPNTLLCSLPVFAMASSTLADMLQVMAGEAAYLLAVFWERKCDSVTKKS